MEDGKDDISSFMMKNHYQQLKNLGIDTQKYSKIFVKYTTWQIEKAEKIGK